MIDSIPIILNHIDPIPSSTPKNISHQIRLHLKTPLDIFSLFHDLEINSFIDKILLYQKTKQNSSIMVRFCRNKSKYFDKSDQPYQNKVKSSNVMEIVWKKRTVRITHSDIVITSTNIDIKDDELLIREFFHLIKYDQDYDVSYENFRQVIYVPFRISWSSCIFSHILSIHKNLNQVMAYVESQDPISARSKEIICVSPEPNKIVMVSLRCQDQTITIKTSNAQKEFLSKLTLDLMIRALVLYKQLYKSLAQLYELQIFDLSSIGSYDRSSDMSSQLGHRISYLRNMVPDLFISGYSRECPVLPILIKSEQEAKDIENSGKLVIQYPIRVGYYYVAPEKFFIGLKRNRLKNRHQYEYLVNCYPEDHSKRDGSHLIRYYCPESSGGPKFKQKRYMKTPSNLKIPNIYRMIVPENSSELIKIFGAACGIDSIEEKIKHVEWCPQLARQEYFWLTNNEIENILVNTPQDATNIYRCLEDEFGIDIILININTSNLATLIIPEHKGDYIWRKRYSKSIVIIQGSKGAYGIKKISYDLLVDKDNNALFCDDHPLIVKLVKAKYQATTLPRYPHTINKQYQQYIDENGKCVAVIDTITHSLIYCYCEPLNLECFEKGFERDIIDDLNEGLRLTSINQTEYAHFSEYSKVIKEQYYTTVLK